MGQQEKQNQKADVLPRNSLHINCSLKEFLNSFVICLNYKVKIFCLNLGVGDPYCCEFPLCADFSPFYDIMIKTYSNIQSMPWLNMIQQSHSLSIPFSGYCE